MRIGIRYANNIQGIITLVLLYPMFASAQSPSTSTPPQSSRDHRALGYIFVAPGAYIGYSDSIPTLHLGGGGEVGIGRGWGLGAEVGGIVALRESRGGLGLFSVNGSYGFDQRGKVSPFLAGGYSVVGGHGLRNLVNYGGGVNFWLQEGKGIRLEFRDHCYMSGSRRHLLGFRIGFVFR